MSGVAGEMSASNPLRYALDQTISQTAESSVALSQLVVGQLGGPRETDHVRHILGAGALTPLLTAALQLRQHRGAATHVKSANPLRSVQLMPRERQEIDPNLVDVHLERAARLNCISVKDHASAREQPANLGQRLDRA